MAPENCHLMTVPPYLGAGEPIAQKRGDVSKGRGVTHLLMRALWSMVWGHRACGKLACARGGSRLSPEGGGGGVWEMDTCDRTYVWSSLSAFFFLVSLIFDFSQILT